MQDKDGNLLPDYEPLMAVNGFSLTKLSKGIQAIAARITNLLFQEKGTCPDDFDMGAGIKTFLFEPASGKTRFEIESEVTYQIKEYIQDASISKVETEFITPSSTKQSVAGKTLTITIGFSEPIDGKTILGLKVNRNSKSAVEISYFTD